MSTFLALLKERIYFYRANFINQKGTISFNTLLPTRNKFFFLADIIKHSRPGGNKFTECCFSILWISEAFRLQKNIDMFEKVKICR